MGSAALKGCHDVQNIGAVMSYQRRYLWMTALEIAEPSAVDSNEARQKKDSGPRLTAAQGEVALNLAQSLRDAWAVVPPDFGGAAEIWESESDVEVKAAAWEYLRGTQYAGKRNEFKRYLEARRISSTEKASGKPEGGENRVAQDMERAGSPNPSKP
jgi:hypothetical protein